MSAARAKRRDDGKTVLCSPEVGLWREAPALGALVRPGVQIGRIEVLGRLIPIHAPEGAFGIVVEQGGAPGRARRPVGWGDPLLVLDPEGAAADATVAEQARSGVSGMVFAAPTGGRFYRRPAPDKAAFVEEGAEIAKGQTVAIVEVMKTFNRISYEGAHLPARARVVRVVPADGDDLAPGDPILELEPC